MGKTRFKELSIGDTFDFINDENLFINSFYRRCTKTATRLYSDGETVIPVGSINYEVFHVERKGGAHGTR